MSDAVASRRRCAPETAVGGHAAEVHRDELLEAAGAGDAWAVGQLCDHHGGALIGLVGAILGDPGRSETVVVDVIARACVDSGTTAAAPGSLRRELARLTYLCATNCLGDLRHPALDPPGAEAARRDHRSRRQRAALLLVHCGDHTVGDVAALFDLPVQIVAIMLRSGLRELADSQEQAVGGGLHRLERRR